MHERDIMFIKYRRLNRLFLCQNLDIGDGLMFKDEILERIFADKEMSLIPLGCQSTAISVIERILEEIKEENPYASLSELFNADE